MTPLSKEFRLVVDYRMLNKQTIKDKYPLPDIEVMFDEMHGAKFFSSFDAVDGFWQVPIMAPGDVEKTAFTTHMGSYEWLVMPQGLQNSPSVHRSIIGGVFLKRSKVQLLKKSLRFLGHTISADGCRPQHDKTDASGIALGGVLVQDNGDGLRVIAYESRQFSAAEQSYHTGDRELCATHHCTTATWRHYLIFTNFRLQGDHRPMEWLMEPGRELSLGGRLSEESVVAIVDLISVLAAQEDENAKQIQDTEADQPQGVAHVEDPQAGEVPYHQTV
eukprot:gene34036-biopygen5509